MIFIINHAVYSEEMTVLRPYNELRALVIHATRLV